VLYIGDDRRDIEAGRAANMPTAAALWGYIHPDDKARDWGADFYFAKPQALQDWLEQSFDKK